jgi:LPXTG-site transpeptidase (sortase) family protein
MTRPRPALIVLVVSLLLLAIAPIWLLVAGSGASEAQLNSVNSAGQSRTESSQLSPEVTQPLRIGTPVIIEEPIQVAEPVSLFIPGLNVLADVIPVGVDSSRQVVIPEDISQVGWYQFGARPGQGNGSSVLVGHRDGRNYGKGAFYNLATLKPGDQLTVTTAAGDSMEYQVTGREAIYKQELPLKELFREDGNEVLTLISCIGVYREGQGYDQNVIITAEPIRGA